MKNSQKGFIVPLLIIIAAILITGGGFYYYSKTKKSTRINDSIQNSDTTSDFVQKEDLAELSHSSRGYSWTITHPRRYKFLTNINADGPFVQMGINDADTCKISVTAPAREKDAIEKSGLDTVHNKFIEDQKKALVFLEKTKMFGIEKPNNASYANLTGVMFEFRKGIDGMYNLSFIAKYPNKNMIVAIVLECVPFTGDANLLSQYKNELIGIISSFK